MDATSGPALELAVVSGDSLDVTALPERGTLMLGRDAECEIRIDHRSVSRRHAALHVGPVVRIQDLGSANGTFVRDAHIVSDTSGTTPLRKLSRESIEVPIGERINLGAISIVVRRTRRAGVADGIVVEAPAMRALYDQAARAARTPISVLILGETGVGKEVLARAIHDRSPRAGAPYVELNCAALPPSLLESELFGYEKHAFTGAAQARPGLLEAADGGTVFLDEIGELPLSIQVKLLRVLEDRKVTRIGGRAPRRLDVRFVSATNRDLEAEIVRGTFRQDLYFRLEGVAFTIPPLRERTEDIAPLAQRFLRAAARTLDRAAPLVLSPEALGYLERYRWPGNVRELRNAIERAVVLSQGDEITPADLPTPVTGVSRAPAAAPGRASSDERERIIAVLAECAGNQTRAAKALGMSLRTLVNRLASHNIARPRKPA